MMEIISRVTYLLRNPTGEVYSDTEDRKKAAGFKASLYQWNIRIGDIDLWRPVQNITDRVILPVGVNPDELVGVTIRETIWGEPGAHRFGRGPMNGDKVVLERLVAGEWMPLDV